MAQYIKLEDIQAYPIRLNKCDKKNGNLHFILGIESVMEYVDYLPIYELSDTEPIIRQDFDYEDFEQQGASE